MPEAAAIEEVLPSIVEGIRHEAGAGLAHSMEGHDRITAELTGIAKLPYGTDPWTLPGSSSATLIGIRLSDQLETGAGHDHVKGRAELEGEYGVPTLNAAGIVLGNTFDMGSDDPRRVAEAVQVEEEPFLTYLLSTSDGHDRISGHGEAEGQDGTAVNAVGIIQRVQEPQNFVVELNDDEPFVFGVHTGTGNDRVKGVAYATTGDSVVPPDDALAVQARNDPSIAQAKAVGLDSGWYETDTGHDKVEGIGYAEAGNNAFAQAHGIKTGDSPFDYISTGDGRDHVYGKAEASIGDGGGDVGNDFAAARLGFLNSSRAISVGIGRDPFLEAKLAVGVEVDPTRLDDLELATIETGADADRVQGSAKSTAGQFAQAQAVGIFGVDIHTGPGSDKVHGSGEASAESGGIATAVGILDSYIRTEDQAENEPVTSSYGGHSIGRGDTVQGIARVRVEDGVEDGAENELARNTPSSGIGDSAGIDSSQIHTSESHDSVKGSAYLSAGDRNAVSDNAGISLGSSISKSFVETESEISIATYGGNDLVKGYAHIEVGEDSLVESNAGIQGGGGLRDKLALATEANEPPEEEFAIVTGEGRDKVIGHLKIEAGYESTLADNHGIVGVGIDTGGGNDLVKGIVEIHGAGYEDGDVLASFGIADSAIYLGDGRDKLIARGVTAGIEQVEIHGEGGNDVIDVQNGKGMIDGGEGHRDFLVLEGDFDEFEFVQPQFREAAAEEAGDSFTPPDGENHVIIQTADETTYLEVQNVEYFKFDDQVVHYDNLFDIA